MSRIFRQHTINGSLDTVRLGTGVLVQNLCEESWFSPRQLLPRLTGQTYSKECINVFLLGLFLRLALVRLPRVPLVFTREIHHTYPYRYS